MKVKVSYPIVRTMEIEIPDELTNKYKNAYAKDDDYEIDFACESIDEYIKDTIPQIDTDVDCLDWLDWFTVE